MSAKKAQQKNLRPKTASSQKTASKRQKEKNDLRTGIIAIVLIALGFFIFGHRSKTEDVIQNDGEKSAETEEAEKRNERGGYVLEEIEFEEQCQLLADRLVTKDIKVINVFDNRVYFIDHNGYDKDGNSIAMYTWNGKNKTTGNSVSFACWGSASDGDHISIYVLSINGSPIYGSLDFPTYSKTGELIE